LKAFVICLFVSLNVQVLEEFQTKSTETNKIDISCYVHLHFETIYNRSDAIFIIKNIYGISERAPFYAFEFADLHIVRVIPFRLRAGGPGFTSLQEQ